MTWWIGFSDRDRAGLQGGDFRRIHGLIIADRRAVFQRHVTPECGPVIIVFEHERAVEASCGLPAELWN